MTGASYPRICPVYIDGTFEVLPRHRRIPRPKRVRVIFGPTVASEAVAPPGADDASATADAIRGLVAALEPAVSGKRRDKSVDL